MEKTKQAWITWSREKHSWILMILNDNEWEISKSWIVKDYIDETYVACLVPDSILIEIAVLQDIGYQVKVTLR